MAVASEPERAIGIPNKIDFIHRDHIISAKANSPNKEKMMVKIEP